MKKVIALFLVFSLLTLSGNLYAKKKGANLIIHKKDFQVVRGELIAVKEKSLLLLSESGADVSADIGDVSKITIVSKSKSGKGALVGLLVGGVIGAAAAGTSGGGGSSGDWFSDFGPSGGQLAILGVVIFGGLGALIGSLIGARSRGVETIQIEGKSDTEIKEILQKLRSKARVLYKSIG